MTVTLLCVVAALLVTLSNPTGDSPVFARDPQLFPEQIFAAEGKVTLLRAHDVGTGFGPPADFIDAEVVVRLDSQPGRSFGFQLRNDTNEGARRAMLNLLRDAFNHNWTVRIDYVDSGGNNSLLLRTTILPSYDIYLPLVIK